MTEDRANDTLRRRIEDAVRDLIPYDCQHKVNYQQVTKAVLAALAAAVPADGVITRPGLPPVGSTADGPGTVQAAFDRLAAAVPVPDEEGRGEWRRERIAWLGQHAPAVPGEEERWWEEFVVVDCPVGHRVAIDDGDGGVYSCPLCALAARSAPAAPGPDTEDREGQP